MKFTATVLVLVAALPALAAEPAKAQVNDSLLNGAFSAPLATGWQQQARDLVGFHSIAPLKDGGVKVAKEMCGPARLYQDVKLSGLDRVFSTRARFDAEATKPGYYACSAVILEFQDSQGKPLGETRHYFAAGTVPWKNSGTLHLVPVARSGTWTDIAVNLADELKTFLKGVDPGQVKRLRVAFESFGSGTDTA